MRKPLPPVRFIDPASIDEGDAIRVVWTVQDVEHSRTARVERIRDRVYYSASGQEIFRWGDAVPRPYKVRVTLIEKGEDKTMIPLFDRMDEVRERAAIKWPPPLMA